MIHPSRIQRFSNKNAHKGSYVLYWMQSSVRVVDNTALNLAAPLHLSLSGIAGFLKLLVGDAAGETLNCRFSIYSD